MIVRTLDSIRNTQRHIKAKTNRDWASLRYLLKKDGFPFSVNHTELSRGCRMEIAYQNHTEACVCIQGTGRIHNKLSGETHTISPGVLYALEKGEKHTLEAIDDLVLISIFSPPLMGPEVHDQNGSYSEMPCEI